MITLVENIHFIVQKCETLSEWATEIDMRKLELKHQSDSEFLTLDNKRALSTYYNALNVWEIVLEP